MIVREMIERLGEYDQDAEVRIASQPSYPLQSTVRGVCSMDEVREYSTDDLDDSNSPEENVVFIVEASQVYETPYAPRDCFEVAS